MSEDKQRESIFGIMDDLLSHLNRTKKLFMALVISSFVVAPLAIVLSMLIFIPPFLTGTGQQQDVVISARTGVIEGVPDASFTPDQTSRVRIVLSEDAQRFNVTLNSPPEGGTLIVDRSQVQVEYTPAGELQNVSDAQQTPPRFLYVVASTAPPFDVTGIIMAVVGVSAAMAGTWLFIGIKEYRFFANWNKRYTGYRTMQEKVDKELEEEKE